MELPQQVRSQMEFGNEVRGVPVLSGWPQATGGRRLIRKFYGDLLCARDAALAHPGNK